MLINESELAWMTGWGKAKQPACVKRWSCRRKLHVKKCHQFSMAVTSGALGPLQEGKQRATTERLVNHARVYEAGN